MRRTLTALPCAALLALTACTGGEDEPVDERAEQLELGLEADEEDEARLIAAMEEADDVAGELEAVVKRLLRECMEDKGFTVHDEAELFIWPTPAEQTLEFEAPVDHIPTAEEAAENGFMAWAVTYEGSEHAPEEEVPDYMDDYHATMDMPFYDLPGEERDAWDRAYRGVEVEQWRDGDADEMRRPEPGGCDGSVHRSIYGDPARVADPDAESVYWQWGPTHPMYVDWDHYDDLREWRELTATEEIAFLTCLDEGGNPGWELNDDGYVDTYWWLKELYQPDPANAGIEFDPLPEHLVNAMPEIPADVPYDYDKAFGIEIALAEDFAACADETGYREAGETRWRAMHIGRMLDHESEVLAWQDETKGYLEKAQDLLAA